MNPEFRDGAFFQAKYKNQTSELTFLGSRHIGHDRDTSSHETFFKELEEKIAAANPAVMVLEPIMPFDMGGYSPCQQSVGLALLASQQRDRAVQQKYDACMTNTQYSRIGLNQIKAWYQQKTGSDLTSVNPDELYEQTAPNRSRGKLNEIAAVATEIRNARTRSVIFDNLQRRHRVMAVYGDGHLFQNHAVFQARITTKRWF